MHEAQRGQSLPRLVEIMRRLLGPGGCPWDREQTLQSLRPYVIEEAFEVVDAIDGGSPTHLREELGDLLMQVVFGAELARAEGWFGPDDVIGAIADKLVRRHPHVFEAEGAGGAGGAEGPEAPTGAHGGDDAHEEARPSDRDAVARSWHEIKAAEKPDRGALEGVPVAMPALLRAVRISEKAARVGYDWSDSAGVRAKVDEELAELDEARRLADREAEERELGDLLFALASLARKRSLDPEAALRGALDRFAARFAKVEAAAKAEGVRLTELDADELDRRWEAAKASEPSSRR